MNQLLKLAGLVACVVSVWSKTLRYELKGFEAVQAARKKGAVLYVLWHDELFAPLYVHRQQNVLALVSRSRDGEFLAQILRKYGYALARGSSSRGGVQGLKELLSKIKGQGLDAVITIDGPRGPRHQAKPGAIYLAYKANIPLIPVRVHNSRAKYFKSWDRFQLPWPGSRSVIYYGEPYYVRPGKMNNRIMEEARQELEQKMDNLLMDL